MAIWLSSFRVSSREQPATPVLSICVGRMRGKTAKRKEINKLTNGGQNSGDSLVVFITDHLVRADDATADALNDTDLASTLILKLAQAEGEVAELLHNLRQSGPRARALEAVGGIGAAVKGGTVGQILDLAGAQADTNFDAPDIANLGGAVASDALARSKDDLLLALDF